MIYFDGGVHGLGGHGSVGGPLATGYRDEAAVRDVHHMVPHSNKTRDINFTIIIFLSTLSYISHNL